MFRLYFAAHSHGQIAYIPLLDNGHLPVATSTNTHGGTPPSADPPRLSARSNRKLSAQARSTWLFTSRRSAAPQAVPHRHPSNSCAEEHLTSPPPFRRSPRPHHCGSSLKLLNSNDNGI